MMPQTIGVDSTMLSVDKITIAQINEYINDNTSIQQSENMKSCNVTDIMNFLQFIESVADTAEKRRRNKLTVSLAYTSAISLKDANQKLHAAFDNILSNIDPSDLDSARKIMNYYHTYNIYGLSTYDKIAFSLLEHKYQTPDFQQFQQYIRNSCIIWPYKLISACQHKLDITKPYTTPDHFFCYKIKPAMSIRLWSSQT